MATPKKCAGCNWFRARWSKSCEAYVLTCWLTYFSNHTLRKKPNIQRPQKCVDYKEYFIRLDKLAGGHDDI